MPNTAIYEGVEDWRYKDGTSLNGDVILPSGENVNADVFQKPVSDEFYFIVPNKCTECKGFHEELNVQLFAQLIAVYQMKIILSLKKSFWGSKIYAPK